mmetsp:Transcript_12824/g.19267  ORF Transcript_12824/g.19267 Transcript_12824/m.19267 type:complete len:477 (+) Transcript_12824:12-1442(+)
MLQSLLSSLLTLFYVTEEGAIDFQSLMKYYSYFFIFMIMGSGANWVFPTALSQEIPYLEEVLPEKLCIATYMNATTNLGLVSMLCYLYIHSYIMPIPYYYSVPSLLIVSAVGSYLSAGIYSITTDGFSLSLYFCCAIGGSVGALSSVIMNPFMTTYRNNFISAARSGGSAYILLCAIVSIAQNPGASDMRFSVTTYMTIFGVLLSLPICAYQFVIHYKLGLRESVPEQNPKPGSVELLEGEKLGLNPLHKSLEGMESNNTVDSSEVSQLVIHPKNINDDVIQRILNGFMDKISSYLVPNKWHENMPWLRRTVPYMLTVGWVNFNTWGMVTALLPFAMSNVSQGSGSNNLAIAYEAGAVLLVLGDLSTTVFQMRFYQGLTTFSAFCITIYLASANLSGFHTPAAAPLLIIIFAVERFIEAHLVTSAYRAIATDFAIEHRQAASRAVGISDQMSTTLGAVISTVLVTLLYSCTQPTDD